MKRLRNIAVRMRPAAPGAGEPVPSRDLDWPHASLPDLDGTPPAAEPPWSAAADGGAPAPASARRAIWDMDPALETGDPIAGAPQADPPEPAPVPVPARPIARSKTRVLGFTEAAALADPLHSRARPAPQPASGESEPRFAAGWLVIVEGPGRGADFAVTGSVSTIGRDPDQAIRLDFGDTAISRQGHASVVYDPEQNRFFIGHGGKSNIVRHNGQPVLSTQELCDGDHIRIGKTTLFFKALCGPSFTWDAAAADAGGSHD
jgi:hypothetical protein